MTKQTFGIYAIRSLCDNKRYIGSTILSFRKRWTIHRSELRRNVHTNRHLQSAWNLYGEGNFSFEILEVLEDQDLVLGCEQFWLDQYADSGLLYNHLLEAINWRGYKHTENSKLKISQSQKGKKHSETTRALMSQSQKGREVSAETREKISHARQGMIFADEHKAKIGIAKCGENHHNYGKHLSEELRSKIGNSQKGKNFTDEHKAKLSIAKKGKPWSEQRRLAQLKRQENNSK